MHHKILSDSKKTKKVKQFTKKVILNLLFLFFFRLGALTPLGETLKDILVPKFSSSDKNIYLEKAKHIYFIKSFNSVNLFSLGIIPYINASFLIELLATLSDSIGKSQEKGGPEKKTLELYKKKLAVFTSGISALTLLLYLGVNINFENFFLLIFLVALLTVGSLASVYIKEILDLKGVGNGASQILFMKIILDFFEKDNIFLKTSFFQVLILFFFLCFCFSLQKARVNIKLVSSRQLASLEEINKNIVKNSKSKNFFPLKQNGLPIKLNQVGLLPVVIASSILNYLPFFQKSSLIATKYFFFSFFIITFNCFYTLLLWNPEKVAKELLRTSTSILNIEPGKETQFYLKKMIMFSSLSGGLLLCLIVICYDLIIKNYSFTFLRRINIASLLMLTELAFGIQKSLYYFEDDLIEKI